MKREKKTTNSSIRKVKKLKLRKNVTKLVASGAIFTLLSAGAIYKSKPRLKECSTPLMGLDISNEQVENDWNLIKNRFHYIIIRIDDRLDENYMYADNNNLEIGAYLNNELWKNTYNNLGLTEEGMFDKFREEQEIKIDEQLSKLIGKDINWPVYLRIVDKDLPNNLPKEYMDCLLEIYKRKAEEKGFVPGIFSDEAGYNYLISNDSEIPNKFATWVISSEEKYHRDVTYLQTRDEHKLLNSHDIKMVQGYNSVLNTGAKNSMGTASVNYSKVDYYVKKINYPLCLLAGYSAMKLYDRYEYIKDNKRKKKTKKLTGGSKIK